MHHLRSAAIGLVAVFGVWALAVPTVFALTSIFHPEIPSISLGSASTSTVLDDASAGINPAGTAAAPPRSKQMNTDVAAGYNNLAARLPTATVFTELGGTTKTPGIYNSTGGTFTLTGDLVLDARHDPNAVFIFQTATALTTAPGSAVQLINGANACQVFWQVGSVATLGAHAMFQGTIVAFSGAVLDANVHVLGRVLVREGTATVNATASVTPPCTSTTIPLEASR